MTEVRTENVVDSDPRNDQLSKGYAEKVSDQSQEFCIIGLTGKIKSGTSDVSKLLSSFDFCNIVTQPANTSEFTMSEIREHKVIYRYLQHHWRPFVVLEVASVILSFLLETTPDDLEKNKNVKYIVESICTELKNNTKQFCQYVVEKIEETDKILQFSRKEHNEYKEADLDFIKNECEIVLKEILSEIEDGRGLFKYWKKIKGVFESNQFNTKVFIFCYGVLPALDQILKRKCSEKGKYTTIFHDFGNNIRSNGSVINQNCSIESKNLFVLSERINKFIKILRYYPKYLYEDIDKRRDEDKHRVFVVINNFKNIFEAYYFKKRYTIFYLLAVSCDEEMRIKKFGSEADCRLADLKENFSRGKKLYSDVIKYQEKHPEIKFGDDEEEIFTKELGFNHSDFQYIREIFESENSLRKSAYECRVASFILQDVITCIENSDIFVMRDYSELNYKCDYLLIRLLGRIITLIMHPGLLTPTKMERCMQIAMTAKLNSGCLSRQVGAVVTDSNYNILSLGWNDSPCGVESCIRRNLFDLFRKHDPEAYSDYELCNTEFRNYIEKIHEELVSGENLNGLPLAFCFKDIYQDIIRQRDQIYTRALHGEERALATCGNERAKGGYLFTTSSPCELCAKKAKEAHISTIFYIEQYPGISRTHIIEVGKPGDRARYILFTGAVGVAYVKLYTPTMPYKDELEALSFSPVFIHKRAANNILENKQEKCIEKNVNNIDLYDDGMPVKQIHQV